MFINTNYINTGIHTLSLSRVEEVFSSSYFSSFLSHKNAGKETFFTLHHAFMSHVLYSRPAANKDTLISWYRNAEKLCKM